MRWRLRTRRTWIALGLRLGTFAAGGTAWAAFSSITSNGTNTFTVAPDLTAPGLTRATVAKATGAQTSQRFRAGGGYYVYAEIPADTGNPASGLQSVTANTGSFDSGVTAASMTTSGGPWTVAGTSYNVRSGLLTADQAVNTGVNYAYTITRRDVAGNQATSAAQNAQAETYQSVINATRGLVSHWRLAETSGTTAADSAATNVNNGTYANTPTLGVTGALVGDAANRAVTFNGTNEYASAARQIGDDFTIELWFRSTQSFGSGNQWYGGAGLFDADVSGNTADFGTSLSQGRAMGGTGAGDVTVDSSAGLNDGAWHHLVFTRAKASGTLRLYVDGSQVSAIASASTASLTAPSQVAMARLQTGVNYFAGSLDEVAVYGAVLPDATILDHYRAAKGTG